MTEARRMSAEARDFANKNTERAMRVAGDGITWWRNIAEQNLNQSRAVLEGCLSTTRMAMDSIDHQASDIRERSMSLAETMLTNTFDFARGVFHIVLEDIGMVQNDRRLELVIAVLIHEYVHVVRSAVRQDG